LKNYFVKWVHIKPDNSGTLDYLPVIYTEQGILLSFLHYLLDNRDKSKSWTEHSAYALSQLVSYNAANKCCFDKPVDMFKEFSNKLFTGTIDETTGDDPSSLRWKIKRTYTANRIIGKITHFADWLADKNVDDESHLNPWKSATTHDQLLNWAAWSHRHKNAFLAHLWRKDQAEEQNQLSREIRNRQSPKVDQETVKAFPEEYIDALLTLGFVFPGTEHKPDFYEHLNLRDVLMIYLMHYGGLRLSETLQLYVSDIYSNTVEPDTAVVKVYHPSQGAAPLGRHGQRYPNRAVYLREEFGLKPRNDKTNSSALHVGWKDPMLDSKDGNYFVVRWAPPESSKLFLTLWKAYLQYQRVTPDSLGHPFVFTTKDGKPYNRSAFNSNYARAVERIGLTLSHKTGIRPHGHRHAYGKRLDVYGLSTKARQKALHHKCIESQAVYTEKTEKEIQRELTDAFSSFTLSDITQ
jgi:site-specific recombinase XerD